MEKSQNIDFALYQTLVFHPEFRPHLNQLILDNIGKDVNLKNFTKKNGARESISQVTSQDFIKYLLEEAIKIYNAASYFYGSSQTLNSQDNKSKYDSFKRLFPYYDKCYEILKQLNSLDGNIALYVESNQLLLIDLSTIVTKTKFSEKVLENNQLYYDYINQNGTSNTIIEKDNVKGKKTTKELLDRIEHDFVRVRGIENITINHSTINKCLADILNGAQLQNVHNEYRVGDSLFVTQDIGRQKSNQEDCAIILEHPQNKNVKLLAVSDGMGGVKYGDKASLYIIQEVSTWFNNLPIEAINNIDLCSKLFAQKIADISNVLFIQYNNQPHIKAGATFTGAVINEHQTAIINIGDSRAYTIKNSELDILTKDQSAIWDYRLTAKEIGAESIDEMRFDRMGNQIWNCVGKNNLEAIQRIIINNEQYDRLILTSDGVSDLLSLEQFKIISANTPKDLVTKFLVAEAINNKAYREKPASLNYYQEIDAGKDNATAAMFARR